LEPYQPGLIMDKNELETIGLIIKELLICSVMTRANILEPLLQSTIESFVFYTNELSKNSALVPEEFYLPAPPIFCIQMQSLNGNELNKPLDDLTFGQEISQIESNLRLKLYSLCKCMITILTASNLHVPLIKWYIEHLTNNCQEMKHNYGIANSFELNFSLRTLLTMIRYQKLGYIPDSILLIFRDFCSVLFYLDLRDKFSLALRQYSRYFILNQNVNYEHSTTTMSQNVLQMCLQIIDYGNAMLAFGSFLKEQHAQIKDIVLSTIAKLTKVNQYSLLKSLNLEQKLALCVSKKSFYELIPGKF
jgi:hypothetical protein